MPRPFFLTGMLFSFAFFSTLAVAQSTGSSQSSSANSQQSSSASSSPKTKSDQAGKPQERKKPKKVWTNEEVGSLNSTVSIVGDSASASVGGPATSSGAAASGAAEHFRRQLVPLRSELAEIDRQIREVKSRGAQEANYNNSSLDKLEDRKKSIQLKIDAIEEDARRQGVAPGDLR